MKQQHTVCNKQMFLTLIYYPTHYTLFNLCWQKNCIQVSINRAMSCMYFLYLNFMIRYWIVCSQINLDLSLDKILFSLRKLIIRKLISPIYLSADFSLYIYDKIGTMFATAHHTWYWTEFPVIQSKVIVTQRIICVPVARLLFVL